MKKRILKAAPDYLPLSTLDFIKHFNYVFTLQKNNLTINYNDCTLIYGYSCRSLFEICLMYFNKEDLVIATTPVHHTSYRNIIEKYVKPENIHIIELNSNYNEIENIPNLERCDLVVITHLFGQDMDLSVLSDFKKKHNCVIIEDRVQGGTLDERFSDETVDVAIYSMGMDKRPIALGGGYMFIDNIHDDLIRASEETIEKLPIEKRRNRYLDLVKKIPTYLFYNSRIFIFLTIKFINFMNFFSKKITLLSIAVSYRTKNPGFSHHKYMLKPSRALLKSMVKNLNKYKKLEQRYIEKHKYFTDCLSPELIAYFFPWFKDNGCLTPYNTILIEEHRVTKFLEFLCNSNMSCIANPTYKVFNHTYEKDSKDIKFNNGIVYLPSIANMKKTEIEYLAYKLKEFYELF